MIDLKHLQDHLQTITQTEWQTLFDLIPEIESTEIFAEYVGVQATEDGYIFPYIINGPIIDQFVTIAYNLEIIPAFDWPQWEEGRIIINNVNYDFSKLTLVDLCKLLTVIVRSDRFSEGNLEACFLDGTILKILYAMKAHVMP